MKKLMAIIGAALLLVGVTTSCSKTCLCTTKTDDVSDVTKETTINMGKCSDMNKEITMGSYHSKTECVQK